MYMVYLWIFSDFITRWMQHGIGLEEYGWYCLTLWRWVTHICVCNLTIIGSDNGFSYTLDLSELIKPRYFVEGYVYISMFALVSRLMCGKIFGTLGYFIDTFPQLGRKLTKKASYQMTYDNKDWTFLLKERSLNTTVVTAWANENINTAQYGAITNVMIHSLPNFDFSLSMRQC